MATHVGKSFTDQRVQLDGDEFDRCTFTRCRLVYAATTPLMLSRCTINDSPFEFEGAASNAIGFLQGLYHGMGPAGKAIVEQTFENIRRPPAAPAFAQ